MATGALDANGIWIYGEDDSEATFSGLLNKLGDSTSDVIADLKQAGRVVQVATGTRNSIFSTTSTTLSTVTGVEATITPRSVNSKILVRVSGFVSVNSTISARLQLVRGSTAIGLNAGGSYSAVVYSNNAGTNGGMALEFLDSPASTAALTYRLQLASATAGTAVAVGGYLANTASTVNAITTITVMEVTA